MYAAVAQRESGINTPSFDARAKKSRVDRADFLQALDRDISEAFHCYICSKIHLLAPANKQALGAEERYQRVCDSRCLRGGGLYNFGTVANCHADFKFEHIQMAMKLYRGGSFP